MSIFLRRYRLRQGSLLDLSAALWFAPPHLQRFSHRYCRWVGIKFDNQIAQLPFGLVLKWSDVTRLEEVTAMMMMRRSGFPVPKVISYGDGHERAIATTLAKASRTYIALFGSCLKAIRLANARI
jgi:hypothetical protein